MEAFILQLTVLQRLVDGTVVCCELFWSTCCLLVDSSVVCFRAGVE
jgi:hypothetical protein